MRLDKICRACLCEDDNMISMLEKNIFKKFLAFTDLPVQKEILNVSLNLCLSCEEKLNISYAFKEKCSKSHQILLCHVNNAEALQIGYDEQEDVEETHVEADNFQRTATTKQEEVEEPIVTTDNNNSQLIAADDGEGVEEPPVTTDSKQCLTLQKFSPHKVLEAIEKTKRYRYANTKCNYCKFVPINFGSMSIHMSRIHKDLRENWCQLCNETYEDFTIHTEIRHSEDLTCTFCKQKFLHETSLHSHLRRHSDVQLFTCRNCEKCFVSRLHLNRHLKTHKKPHSGSSKRGEKLSLCGKSLMQRSHLFEYNKKHSNLSLVTNYNNIFQSIATDEQEGGEEPPVTTGNLQTIPTDERADVTTDNEQYSTLRRVSPCKVLQAIEKSKRYFYGNTKCIYCKFVTIDFRTLSVHMSRAHDEQIKRWCRTCNEEHEDLTNHRETRHRNDLTCTFCKKKFPYKGSLNLHLLRHSGVKLFLCWYCEKCFVSRVHLDRHLKTHKESYDCNKCVKSFTRLQPASADQNLSLTYGKQSYCGSSKGCDFLCCICGQQLMTALQWRMHMEVHAENVPLKCRFCECTHTWKKPHVCLMCGKIFAQCRKAGTHKRRNAVWKVCVQKSKSKLRLHLRRVQGKKSYVYSECGKLFIQRSHLIKRNKTQTNLYGLEKDD